MGSGVLQLPQECWRPKLVNTEADQSDRSGPVTPSLVRVSDLESFCNPIWKDIIFLAYKYKAYDRLMGF